MKEDNWEEELEYIRKHLTIAETAKFIGVAVTSIQNWEKSYAAPRESNQHRIIQVAKSVREADGIEELDKLVEEKFKEGIEDEVWPEPDEDFGDEGEDEPPF